MRHETVTGEIREQAALYALGSLTQHEAHSYESHIREGCPVCENELRQFEAVVARLGFGTVEVTPPEYLRDLLAARIEHEGQLSSTAPSSKVVEEKPKTKPSSSPAPRPIFASPARERPSFLPWMFAAALALLSLLSLYALKLAKDENAQLRQKASAAQADAETLGTLVDIQRQRTDELEEILSIVGKPGARVVILAGQAPSPSASVAVLWDTQKGRWLIMGHLPPAPQGKVYELWFVTPTAKIPACLLKTDPVGRTFTTVEIPGDISKLDAAAVTLESEGGSQQPTMPFHALGKIS